METKETKRKMRKEGEDILETVSKTSSPLQTKNTRPRNPHEPPSSSSTPTFRGHRTSVPWIVREPTVRRRACGATVARVVLPGSDLPLRRRRNHHETTRATVVPHLSQVRSSAPPSAFAHPLSVPPLPPPRSRMPPFLPLKPPPPPVSNAPLSSRAPAPLSPRSPTHPPLPTRHDAPSRAMAKKRATTTPFLRAKVEGTGSRGDGGPSARAPPSTEFEKKKNDRPNERGTEKAKGGIRFSKKGGKHLLFATQLSSSGFPICFCYPKP